MSSLQKLYARKQESASFNAEVNRAVESAVAHIKDSLAEGIRDWISTAEQRGSQGVADGLNTILPAINQIVAESVRAIVTSIEPAVRGIRIPDHTGHLAAIQQAISSIAIPETDLKPVLKALEALAAKLDEDEEEEEKKWVFKVNRDEITKLIESVDVVEGDEE